MLVFVLVPAGTIMAQVLWHDVSMITMWCLCTKSVPASMKTVVPCQHVVGAHSVKFKTLIMRKQHHHSISVGYLAMSLPQLVMLH